MKRDPIICPSCETEFDPLALVRPKRARAAVNRAKAKSQNKPIPNEEAEDQDALLIGGDEDAMHVGFYIV